MKGVLVLLYVPIKQLLDYEEKYSLGWVYSATSSSIILIRFVKLHSDCCHLPFKKPTFWSCGNFLLCTNKYILTVLKAQNVLKTAFFVIFWNNNLSITLRRSIHLKEAYSQPFSWLVTEKGVAVHVGFIFQGNGTSSKQNRGAGHVMWQAPWSLVHPTVFWRVALKLIQLLWKLSSILLNPLKL